MNKDSSKTKQIETNFSHISDALTKTNDEYIMLLTLQKLEQIEPKAAQEVLEAIFLKELKTQEDILKFIRQTNDEKHSMTFYHLLNGNFGEKVIKWLRNMNEMDKELI